MNLHTYGSALLVAALGGCVVSDKDIDSDTGTGSNTTSGSSSASEGSTSPTTGTNTTGMTATGSEDTGLPTSGETATGTGTTTDAGTTAGVDTTTDAGTTTNAGTTTDAGTTAESTTGGPPTIEGSCEAACMVFLECQPDAYPDLPTCAAECIGGSQGGPNCEPAAIEFNTCIGGYTCDQLTMALENNEFGACTDAFTAYTQACNP